MTENLCVRWLICYIQACEYLNMSFMLTFTQCDYLKHMCYVGLEFIGCSHDIKIYVLTMDGIAGSWKSLKNKFLQLLIMHIGFVPRDEANVHKVWMRNFLPEHRVVNSFLELINFNGMAHWCSTQRTLKDLLDENILLLSMY